MLRRTTRSLLRMPKARRPRERAWEIFNQRDFGYQEGSQNWSMISLFAALFFGLLSFEMYQQLKRVIARGDTCPACESAREQYRIRLENKEKELIEAGQRTGVVVPAQAK